MPFLNLKGRLSPTSIRLLLVVTALLAVGLVMVYSASYGYALANSAGRKTICCTIPGARPCTRLWASWRW